MTLDEIRQGVDRWLHGDHKVFLKSGGYFLVESKDDEFVLSHLGQILAIATPTTLYVRVMRRAIQTALRLRENVLLERTRFRLVTRGYHTYVESGDKVYAPSYDHNWVSFSKGGSDVEKSNQSGDASDNGVYYSGDPVFMRTLPDAR